MKKIQTRGLLIAASLAVGLVLSPATGADAGTLNATEVLTSSTQLTTLNPVDRTAIDLALSARANYEASLASYQATQPASRQAKIAYRVALQNWRKADLAQKKAKQKIGNTFKKTVATAKIEFSKAQAGSSKLSKAEAKAARNTAIASASVARNDGLAAIRYSLSKPVKPAKP